MSTEEALRRKLVQAIASVVLLALGLTGQIGGTTAAAANEVRSASVRIDSEAALGSVPDSAFGINTAVWDGKLLDATLPPLLQQAGLKVLRFPGGSTADVYHWQTNTTEPHQSYANPNNTFDAFMGVAHQTSAQAMITVNYGSGTPAEAAAWVKYANITRGYGVTYWEIGNEVYGNGTYGAKWEYDLHTEKGPVAYATNALQFIDAMKAVDPSIKIGVVLTAPGTWPDGVILPGQTMDWNNSVLSILGAKIDFIDIHWYPQAPGRESDAGLLSSTNRIAGMVATLRSEINAWAGGNASHVQIMVTETNSVSYNPGKQTVSLINALFLADDEMTWLEHGVASVVWWDVHNGPVTGQNNSPALYGTADYGDYGILSSGNGSEPPAETPLPPYYGLQMLSKFGVAGDQMLTASSDQNLVAVHAIQQANGNLAVLLINKDAHASYTVTLSVSGYTPKPNPTVYSYGMNSAAIHARREMGLTSTVTIPPYALLTMVYQPVLALTLHVPARSRFSQGSLLVPIHTAPHAHVTVTLQVRGSRPLVLYQLKLDGSTDAQGQFTGRLHGHYAPAKPAQARLTVTAQTPTATVTRTTEVTLLH